MTTKTASERIVAAATAWPGVSARPGDRGELSLRLGAEELGHLHGDRVAHFGFPRDLGTRLREQGRVGPHPVNRHSPKLAARPISSDADVDDVVALLRLNYERLAAAAGREERSNPAAPSSSRAMRKARSIGSFSEVDPASRE